MSVRQNPTSVTHASSRGLPRSAASASSRAVSRSASRRFSERSVSRRQTPGASRRRGRRLGRRRRAGRCPPVGWWWAEARGPGGRERGGHGPRLGVRSVAVDRRGRGGDVAAAELDRMDQQRGELMQRHPSLPTGVQGWTSSYAAKPRGRSRRTPASSPGRTRDGRRALLGRSASCVRSIDIGSRPQVAMQSCGRIIVGAERASGRRALDVADLDRRHLSVMCIRPVGATRSPRTRSSLCGSFGSDGCRSGAVRTTEARGPASVQPGQRQRRTPLVVSVPASSIHSSTSSGGPADEPSPTASTSGTGIASAARSQDSPAASVMKNSGGGEAWVLANSRRPSGRSARYAAAMSPPRTRCIATGRAPTACSIAESSASSSVIGTLQILSARRAAHTSIWCITDRCAGRNPRLRYNRAAPDGFSLSTPIDTWVSPSAAYSAGRGRSAPSRGPARARRATSPASGSRRRAGRAVRRRLRSEP